MATKRRIQSVNQVWKFTRSKLWKPGFRLDPTILWVTVRTKANTIYFPINETWTHLLLSRKISYSTKCVEQFNKKYHMHSSSLQQIIPEMTKSFPLVTNATHRTPIPPREVNHCGGTAVHKSPPKCPTVGCSAPSVFQAVRDLGWRVGCWRQPILGLFFVLLKLQ